MGTIMTKGEILKLFSLGKTGPVRNWMELRHAQIKLQTLSYYPKNPIEDLKELNDSVTADKIKNAIDRSTINCKTFDPNALHSKLKKNSYPYFQLLLNVFLERSIDQAGEKVRFE